MALVAASTARFSPEPKADAHQGVTLAFHDGLHVRKVDVDVPGFGDEVRDPLDPHPQDIVRFLQGCFDAGFTF
jgi:hypothetical protein